VALSRVRRLSGLFLIGINDQALRVHPRIREKDVDFRSGSKNARKIFGDIKEEERERMRKNFIIVMGGKWKSEKVNQIVGQKEEEGKTTGRLEKIREKHQNAYRKWTEKEEGEIVSAFKAGKSIKNISVLTGRQTGGIRSRLIKLGLIESTL